MTRPTRPIVDESPGRFLSVAISGGIYLGLIGAALVLIAGLMLLTTVQALRTVMIIGGPALWAVIVYAMRDLWRAR